MIYRQAIATLLGVASVALAAPSSSFKERDVSPAEMGLRWKSQKRSPLTVLQNIQETTITIVEQNLDVVNNLQILAEQQFAQLVQAEVALVSQVQTIKDNIRRNHFKSRYPSVNTVIVTVTNLVDVRDGENENTRYLINQLLADNGFPDKQIAVMVSDFETRTINVASPSIDLEAIFGTAAAESTASPVIAGFDPNAPFGQLNQSLILPYGSIAPTLDNVFIDPAAIIFADQAGLFIESSNSFLADCGFYQNNGNSFFNLAAGIFTSFNQLALIELAGLANLGNIFNGNVNTDYKDYKDDKAKETKDKGKDDNKEAKETGKEAKDSKETAKAAAKEGAKATESAASAKVTLQA